jgi:hypothetical protein
MAVKGPLFRVAARAASSFAFKEGESFSVSVNTAEDKMRLAFSSRYVTNGYETRVPGDLWLDAVGEANDIRDALNRFVQRGNFFASIVAFGSNAAVATLEPELAFDATPGKRVRPFFQRFMPEEKPVPLVPRYVDHSAVRALVAAIGKDSEQQRIGRALSQYVLALENWRRGSEVLSLAHLFMSAEALKRAAWRRAAAVRNKTPEALAHDWGYPEGREHTVLESYLDAEARKRLVFEGDIECHRHAKLTSDQFEHGFASPGFEPARKWVAATAVHIRKAVLSILDLPDNVRGQLVSEPYTKPSGPRRLETYLWGELAAPSDELAATGNVYPIVSWKRTPRAETSKGTDGQSVLSFSFQQTVTAKLADGVTFKPTRMEIRDGTKAGEMP